MPSRARAIVDEALALRESHPHAPAADVLDLAMQGREVWLEDFFDHMVPPSPFARLVAEAVGDGMMASEWVGICRQLDEKSLANMRQAYAESVLPKFVRRYGFLYLPQDEPRTIGGMPRWLQGMTMTSTKDALRALPLDSLQKDRTLAAKQRRLLQALGATEQPPDGLGQRRVTDADSARPSELRKNDC